MSERNEYKSSSTEGVKSTEKNWTERRQNKAYKFVQKYQKDIPALKTLIKKNLKIRFQDLKNTELTFGEFAENSDEWFKSLKYVCSEEMNVGKGEFKDNPLLGLFYRNAVFTSRHEETLPEPTPVAESTHSVSKPKKTAQ